MSTFFGLTPEYKLSLHKNIFDLVTYGKGGWTWDVVYNLPIFLRSYYMKLLTEALERERGNITESTSTAYGPKLNRV
jgi:hypothetical protein